MIPHVTCRPSYVVPVDGTSFQVRRHHLVKRGGAGQGRAGIGRGEEAAAVECFSPAAEGDAVLHSWGRHPRLD
ncbi:hypothetical protein E2C01_071659 [Portunus trituberculatus]|uniref:Uncharacterized protein n=1 Tax=Portunus trituberculatus TaxID=210409 RepID=A0A5B7HXK4_PORTR|nr:hypothetical protein [Portunus trituberculatus]